MYRLLVSAIAAMLMMATGANAQEVNQKPQPAPAAEKGAAEAKAEAKSDPLDELQVEFNKARRADSAETARTATRNLLDAPARLKGLSPEAQIKFRKALESAETLLATAGAGAIPEGAKAHFDAAQVEIDTARLERAAEVKALKDKVEKGGLIVLAIVAVIILLPILIMLLVACPEVFVILLLIAAVVFLLA
jgi:hypothetical protein